MKKEYVYQRPGWPRFSWRADALSERLVAVRHDQGKLLGKLGTLGFDIRAEASLVVLTSDVVKSSAIEGEVLDPGEVRSSIARKLGLDAGGIVRTRRDTEGIVEVTLDATQQFRRRLTAARLFGWHAALFPTGRAGMGRIAVGRWRPAASDPMQVVSGPIGRQRVHFEAPGAPRVAAEMRGFLRWFNAGPAIDPVLRAGLAHLWFVTVHPFEDGNGRIARAVTDMALARADGTPERFYSMSSRIEAERKDYYGALEAAQRGGLDITAWLAWFLGCLGRALNGAESALGAVLFKAELWAGINRRPVNDRQRVVVNRLLDEFQGFLTTSKYAKLAKCSPDTALRDIEELLAWGVIVKNPGRGRSTSYRLVGRAPEG